MIFLPKKTGCLARFFLASWFWQVGVDFSVISDSDIILDHWEISCRG